MKKIIIIVVSIIIILIATLIYTARLDNNVNSDRYSLDYYKSLDRDTPFSEITEKIGQPDSDIGSGIHIFVYKLSPDGGEDGKDSGEIWLGYADPQKIMYVKYKKADGTIVDL